MKIEMSLINTLYAIKNTLGEVAVRGDENITNMNSCFRALDGCIETLTKYSEEQEKKKEQAAQAAKEANECAQTAQASAEPAMCEG